MTQRSVGEVARLLMTSEKAIRLYGERGLLHPRRDREGAPRLYDGEQFERARRIVLLRRLDIPLASIRELLDSSEPMRVFDAVWSERRRAAAELDVVAEYVRSRLTGDELALRTPRRRKVADRIIASASGSATLPELPQVIPHLTHTVFAHLIEQDVPVIDALFVRYHERATEDYPARISLCVPIARTIVPAAGVEVEMDPAHDEAYIPLNRAEMQDQPLLVLLHDQLSSGASGLRPRGPNREVYYRDPEHLSDEDIVADVAVPVARANL